MRSTNIGRYKDPSYHGSLAPPLLPFLWRHPFDSLNYPCVPEIGEEEIRYVEYIHTWDNMVDCVSHSHEWCIGDDLHRHQASLDCRQSP